MKSYVYTDRFNHELTATFHQGESVNKDNPLIIYIHGGGLIYGSRDDLPPVHIDKLTRVGFNLLCLDYPLIPESNLPVLIDSLQDSINWGVSKFSTDNSYILFGRSAGAYLSLILTSKFLKTKPAAIVSFYGYYSLYDQGLTGKSTFYSQYPLLDDTMIAPIIQKKPLFNAPIEQRFPIYLSYRQRGVWIENMLKGVNSKEQFSLTDEEISNLPPLFIAVSTDDQDVPHEQSFYLNNLATQSELVTVNNLPHDFDRLCDDIQTKQAYHQLVNWLISLTK